MTFKFAKGDNVKLTDKFARTMMVNPRRGRHKIDWVKRRGVVYHVNSHDVFIHWQPMQTHDQLPIAAVEKVSCS